MQIAKVLEFLRPRRTMVQRAEQRILTMSHEELLQLTQHLVRDSILNESQKKAEAMYKSIIKEVK